MTDWTTDRVCIDLPEGYLECEGNFRIEDGIAFLTHVKMGKAMISRTTLGMMLGNDFIEIAANAEEQATEEYHEAVKAGDLK